MGCESGCLLGGFLSALESGGLSLLVSGPDSGGPSFLVSGPDSVGLSLLLSVQERSQPSQAAQATRTGSVASWHLMKVHTNGTLLS